MRRPYWDYYRTIEDDLIVVSRYVEFVKSNFACYSVELARILLVAGSELDMVLKKLCRAIQPASRASTIMAYRPIIIDRFASFSQERRYVRSFGITLKPLECWTDTRAPKWWTFGFNKIKHQRDRFFHYASLENALNATAALQIALFHLYSVQEDRTVGQFEPSDMPRLILPNLDPVMTHSVRFLEVSQNS